MTLWDLCIRRPVFTAMIVSAPIVLGIAAYGRLGVDLFPNIDLPAVTVTTTLRGASVEEMETSVTKPIEEIVNTVAGIDELRSTTKEGFSQVVIQFELEKSGPVAAQEVDSKVRSILSQLPEGIDTPVIDRFDLGAAPVMTLAVSGKRDMRELTELARKKIKENLESVPGVGAIALVGGRVRAISVTVDPDKLLKYENLTIEHVRQALIRENQEQPGGRVDRGASEYVLRTLGRVDTPEAFAELIVANRNGQPVRIKDVGRVEDSFEEPRTASRLWIKEAQDVNAEGKTAVSLIVQKQPGVNTVQLVDDVKARLGKLMPTLPPDLDMEIIRDQSRFVKKSIEEVKTHLILAAVLVSASILLFLRDWRTTIIATLSIPTSMIAAFAFMDVMGFTINNISMIAMILAIGIVVDDAVVVHENIFRYIEEYGMTPMQAASAATSEIALAVVATTMSLLVIFAPVIFMGGTVGRFFACFGYIVAFTVLMSMFVSFTMTPVLCSRFLKPLGHDGKGGWIANTVERLYMWLLGWSLQWRWVVVLAAVAVLFSTPILASLVGSDFIPHDDQSEFEVAITLPEGCSLARADKEFQEIDKRLRTLPGVTHTYYTIGDTTGKMTRGQGDVTTGSIYVRLIDLTQREYTQFDVMKQARLILKDYGDFRSAVQDVAVIQATGFRQVDVDLNLRGPDMAGLEKYSEQIAAWMKTRGHYVDVDTSLSLRKPEIRIRPNRERLSDLGVSIQDVASTTNILVGGSPISKYKEGEEQYDVWLRAEAREREDQEAIARMTVPSTKTNIGAVRLDNVASFEPAQGPNTINRFGRQRQVVISANLSGFALGSAVQEIKDHLVEMGLPVEYQATFLGHAKNLSESNSNFAVAFLLAGVFMYMILAAQFESFVHPISILSALPLTIPFAILSLILLRTNLDVYGMFGLFMLFGIVKKNGILQVDYTNQLREKGMERDVAILEANRTRLRPILMTTVMLIAAMIPMAMGEGPGAGARASMAKVILGGQALSLLLTLLLTPIAYSLLDDLGIWTTRWYQWFAGESNAAKRDDDGDASHDGQRGPGPVNQPHFDKATIGV